MKIKKGDNVMVISGANKGKKGKVIKAFPTLNKILVEGINVVKKSVKPKRRGEKGAVVEMPLPINVSNAKKID